MIRKNFDTCYYQSQWDTYVQGTNYEKAQSCAQKTSTSFDEACYSNCVEEPSDKDYIDCFTFLELPCY